MYTISLMLPTGGEFHMKNSGAATFYGCLTGMYGMITCWATLPNFALWSGLVFLACRAWMGVVVCGLYGVAVSILVAVLLSFDETPLDLGIGYYAWVASMGLLLLAGLFRRG
jgi:hypothetical protein